MTKYTKTVAATPEADRANVSKSLKTNRKNHTGFAKLDDPNRTLPIDPSKSEGYSQEVIRIAEQLKGQHEDGSCPQKFTDEFYLQYALKLHNMDFEARYLNVIQAVDVAPDPAYAEYSYEEILAMANNGVNIPKEVIAWAQGQQEADIVDYVVVSDNVENDENLASDGSAEETEVSNLRAEVKDYAIKSKKVQEDITKYKNKTDDITNKAADIERKQNNLFNKNSIDKTESMAKEFKALGRKKKEKGKLEGEEKVKFKQLSEKLSKNNNVIQEIQTNSVELDDFLNSIDNLNNVATEGFQIAQDTINSALNFSNIDEKLNIFTRVHAYRVAATNSTCIEDALNNINDTQLSVVAEKIGQDLQNSANSTYEDIKSSDTQDIVEFSNNYVTRAASIEQASEIIEEDDEEENFETRDSKTQDSEEQGSEAQDEEVKGNNLIAKGMNNLLGGFDNLSSNPFGFIFSVFAMPTVAILAAAGTVAATGVNLAEASVLSTERVLLGKGVKKSDKEDKNLEKEGSKAAAQVGNNNEAKQENDEKIQALTEEGQLSDSETEVQDESQGENVNPNASAIAQIVAENDGIEAQNNSLKDKTPKTIDKSAKLLGDNKKSVTNVDKQAQVMDADTKELQKLAGNTANIGVKNAEAGVVNGIIAAGLMATGAAMLAHFNPYGAYLCAVAALWFDISAKQIAASPIALAAGAVGAAGAAVSKTEFNVANALVKESKPKVKETQQLINETTKALGGEAPQEAENNNQPQNSEGQNVENDVDNSNDITRGVQQDTNLSDNPDITVPSAAPAAIANDLDLAVSNEVSPKNSGNTETQAASPVAPSNSPRRRAASAAPSLNSNNSDNPGNTTVYSATTSSPARRKSYSAAPSQASSNNSENADNTTISLNVPSNSPNRRRAATRGTSPSDNSGNGVPVTASPAVPTNNPDNANEKTVQTDNSSNATSQTIPANNSGKKTEAANQSNIEKTQKTENVSEDTSVNETDKYNNEQKEKNVDPQAAQKSAYGSNINFANIALAYSVITMLGLGPIGFSLELIEWAALVGLSILDLYAKKGVVDKGAEVAEKDAQISNETTKALVAKANQVKIQHDQNVALAKAYGNEFKALDAQSINYQFEMMNNQQKSVESGKISPEQAAQIDDPNLGAKTAIRAAVSGISSKDSKLLASVDSPLKKAEKVTNNSFKSVNGFESLNDKLTDRNNDNDKVGDVIITQSIVAQALITALIAMLMSTGPWNWGLAAMWAVCLVQNALVASTGVGAKLVSDNVEDKIDANSQNASDMEKSLNDNNKKWADTRKMMAKAGLDRMDYLPPEQETPKVPQQQSDTTNKNDKEPQDSNPNNNSPAYARKEKDKTVGFDGSSLNSELDRNNPNDVSKANDYARMYDNQVDNADERTKDASASANINTASKADTTDKADVKLARFNKDGAIHSKKKIRRVNKTSPAHTGRNKK